MADALAPWRAAIIAEARTWLGTPWHHAARVRGRDGGVDCGQLLIAVHVGAGLVPDISTGAYTSDWHLHQSGERFLGFVEAHLDRTEDPLPGDVVVWRYGQCYSHGGIVVEWPLIIHAHRRERAVVYGDGSRGELAREHQRGGGSIPRPVRFYTYAQRALGA